MRQEEREVREVRSGREGRDQLDAIRGGSRRHVPEARPAVLPCLSHDLLFCRVSLHLPALAYVIAY